MLLFVIVHGVSHEAPGQGPPLLAPGLRVLKAPVPPSLGGGMRAAPREGAPDTAVWRFRRFFSNKHPSLRLRLISGVRKLLFMTVLSSFLTAFEGEALLGSSFHLSRGVLRVADFMLFLGKVAH